ncbi:MAG: fumarate reductase subunit C [Dehalococcoidia bacterium]|nr:fumarate reductase subunit C [Dehalococcoidia bacterium]
MAKPFHRPHSNTWWLRRGPYRVFMLREWSATIFAVYTVLLLVLVSKVLDGPEAYDDYLGVLKSPLMIAFHAVALAAALLHTVTWFQAVPKAMPLRIGEEKVPPVLLMGGAYATLLGASVVVVALFLLD